MLAYLVCFFILPLISCSSVKTAPNVSLTDLSFNEKNKVKTALVLDQRFKEFRYVAKVNAKCWEYYMHGKRVKSRKEIGLIVEGVSVGETNEDIFIKGMAALFSEIDTYSHVNEIKNRKEYDFIFVLHFIKIYQNEKV